MTFNAWDTKIEFIHLSCTNKFQIYRPNFNLKKLHTISHCARYNDKYNSNLSRFKQASSTESDSKYFTILSTWQDEIIKKDKLYQGQPGQSLKGHMPKSTI